MIDLSDVTFTIPVKIESTERAENIKIVVNYLCRNFDTNIIIMEQDTGAIPSILKDYKYRYVKCSRSDGLIHRTKMLNDMCKMTTTKYISNYDADVVFTIQQYVDSLNMLRENKSDGVFPYGGDFRNIGGICKNRVLTDSSVNHIIPTEHTCINNNSVGGAIFWNREVFIKGGMENENFLSWGWEDNERISRFKKLGYRVDRISGYLFHMTHARTHNSWLNNPHIQKNEQEFNKINSMNADQLRDYINTWSWTG